MFLVSLPVVHDDDPAVDSFLIFSLGLLVGFSSEQQMSFAPHVSTVFLGLIPCSFELELLVKAVRGPPINTVGFLFEFLAFCMIGLIGFTAAIPLPRFFYLDRVFLVEIGLPRQLNAPVSSGF